MVVGVSGPLFFDAILPVSVILASMIISSFARRLYAGGVVGLVVGSMGWFWFGFDLSFWFIRFLVYVLFGLLSFFTAQALRHKDWKGSLLSLLWLVNIWIIFFVRNGLQAHQLVFTVLAASIGLGGLTLLYLRACNTSTSSSTTKQES